MCVRVLAGVSVTAGPGGQEAGAWRTAGWGGVAAFLSRARKGAYAWAVTGDGDLVIASCMLCE